MPTEIIVLEKIIRKICGSNIPGFFLPLSAKSLTDIDELRIELATLVFLLREKLC